MTLKLWQLIRDVLLTGLAIFVIVSQVYSQHPSDVLLAVALALTAPSVADHARALLSGPGGGAHSPSAPGQQPPQPGGSSGASGDGPDPGAR